MILNLERNKKYILGCSFGPDSMALFDMLIDENYKFVVCNVNYNHRDISCEETANLEAYCKAKNIEFYSISVQFPSKNLNFESWAREIRYNFFFEKGKELGIDSILIAHNEDDLLETYLMQKERDGIVNYYGLKSVLKIKGFEIERPLLNFSKKSLEDYCKKRNVPFSIDVSNYDETYKRNYFRHSVLAKMSDEEKRQLHKEINNENLSLELKNLKLRKYVEGNSVYKKDLLELSKEDVYYLIIYLINKDGYHGNVSKNLIDDMIFAIKKNAATWSHKLSDGYKLTFDYERVSFINTLFNYEEILDKNNLKGEHFEINVNSIYYEKIKNRDVFVIKPCKNALFYGNKRVNRLFIDWKMPHEIRQIWPGIFDKEGNLLYVPRYQIVPIICDNSLLLFEVGKILEIK